MKFTPGTTSRGTDHVFLADILEGEIIFGDMSAGSELIECSLMQRCDATERVNDFETVAIEL